MSSYEHAQIFQISFPLLLMIFISFLVVFSLCKEFGIKTLGANGCECKRSALFLLSVRFCVSLG